MEEHEAEEKILSFRFFGDDEDFSRGSVELRTNLFANSRDRAFMAGQLRATEDITNSIERNLAEDSMSLYGSIEMPVVEDDLYFIMGLLDYYRRYATAYYRENPEALKNAAARWDRTLPARAKAIAIGRPMKDKALRQGYSPSKANWEAQKEMEKDPEVKKYLDTLSSDSIKKLLQIPKNGNIHSPENGNIHSPETHLK